MARLALAPGDVWLAATELSFDIAALELYLPLAMGASIAPAPRETMVDGPRLAALAGVSGAPVMHATPMGWRVLLEGGWRPRGLFTALAAARRSRPRSPTRCRPAARACGTCTARLKRRSGRAPCVSTASASSASVARTSQVIWVARGKRPGASLPIPSARPARAVPHGRPVSRARLDFLGRADQQVKLRGFRIEPGEIGAGLRRQLGVALATPCRVARLVA